jgi:DNA-binding CsgD family transcriptional regulator
VPFPYGVRSAEGIVNEYSEFFSIRSNRNDFHLAQPQFDVGYDYLFMVERELDQDDCTQWRTKFDFRYYPGGPLNRSENALVLAALHFSAKQGHPTKVHIETYGRLRSHLAQALRIRERIDRLDLRHRDAWDVIEQDSVGVIVLKRSGRILECNRLARGILEAADSLVSDGCTLAASRSIDDRALKLLVGSAITDIGGSGNLAIARRGKDRPYSIVVSPIIDHSKSNLPRDARVMILINDPDGSADVPSDLLRAHYGLTRKEADLAVLLTRNLTIRECSGELGIAETTVRRHLATILSRTDLHRQADLVRQVLSLPGPRPQPSPPPLTTRWFGA